MNNNFKCRDCGVVFTADDSEELKCQACGSDNIDLFKKPNRGKMTIIFIVVAFIVAIGVGIGLKYLVTGPTEEEVIMEAPAPTGPIVGTDATGEPIVDPDPIYPPKLEITQEVKPDKSTKTYSFACVVKNLPEGTIVTYELYDFATGKLAAKSNEGNFTGIKPAKDGYKVVATFKIGDKEESEALEITGFDEILDTNLPKLSVADVQKLVNEMIRSGRGAVLSSNAQISPNVMLQFNGLRNDDVAPTNISKLLSQVTMGIWSGMTVESVKYDQSTNKVNAITIRPIYAD